MPKKKHHHIRSLKRRAAKAAYRKPRITKQPQRSLPGVWSIPRTCAGEDAFEPDPLWLEDFLALEDEEEDDQEIYLPKPAVSSYVRYRQALSRYPEFVKSVSQRLQSRDNYADIDEFCQLLPGRGVEGVLLILQLFDHGYEPDLIATNDLAPLPYTSLDPRTFLTVDARPRLCLHSGPTVLFLDVTVATPELRTLDVLRWNDGWSHADLVGDTPNLDHLSPRRALALGLPFQRWSAEDLIHPQFIRRLV